MKALSGLRGSASGVEFRFLSLAAFFWSALDGVHGAEFASNVLVALSSSSAIVESNFSFDGGQNRFGMYSM